MNLILGSCAWIGSLATDNANLVWKSARSLPVRLNESISFTAIPAMLEDYTEHLAVVFSEIIKKLVPQVVGGFMSAGNKQLRADPENVMAVATAEFLDELPAPARMVANMLLPRLQEAMTRGGVSPEEVLSSYKPGLDKR